VIDQSVPQTLQIDAEILQHVLFNLLDNAVKYTSEGGVTVSATADAENLTVNIRDTGPGMKPAEIKELFQKFHRGEAGRSRNLDGTGLGLYVVGPGVGLHRQPADRHGPGQCLPG
jgi:two-component system phosphate regulon sensor histidine kinase PhoR